MVDCCWWVFDSFCTLLNIYAVKLFSFVWRCWWNYFHAQWFFLVLLLVEWLLDHNMMNGLTFWRWEAYVVVFIVRLLLIWDHEPLSSSSLRQSQGQVWFDCHERCIPSETKILESCLTMTTSLSGVTNTQKKRVFFTQNKCLSCICSNPMHLLHTEKSKSVKTECILIGDCKQSVSLSLCLSNVTVWSRLLEHTGFDSCQARVWGIKWSQW